MTILDFDTALHPRDTASGRFEDKAQSAPEFALALEYPSNAVTLSDAQNVTLGAFEVHNQFEQKPFLRAGAGGRVIATYADAEAHEFLHEVTVDEDGAIEDEYIGGSVGIQPESWKRLPPEKLSRAASTDEIARNAVPSAAQSARVDLITAAGFNTSVRVAENGVMEALTVREDAGTAYFTRVFRDGSVVETSEYLERAYDGEMAWVPMSLARARRFAKAGPTA